MYKTMSEKMNHFLILILLLVIVALNIYLILISSDSMKKSEAFCNCFAAQYDGSAANPDEPCYYGGYCYDKEKITKLYDEGAFSKVYAGV